MHCPYCISDIPDEALVCAVCRRDLYVVKPLLERIASLEAQLAAVPPALLASDPPAVAEVAVAIEEPTGSPLRALACWLLPLALLLLGHWLIIFVYDAKVLYLRLLALLLPVPFGFLFARYGRWPFAVNLVPGLLMAATAVWAMSGITALIDHVPVLPQNMAEVREFVEFAASIGLSFITGLWLHAWARRRAAIRARVAGVQRNLVGASAVNGQKMTESLTKLNDAGSAIVAFATTAFSIYTGLKGVLG